MITRTEHEEKGSFSLERTLLMLIDVGENKMPHACPPLHE
jgi:hypothetical protein